MPRPYTKYACEYRCRFSSRSRRKTVQHEKRCLHNPDKRSCLTCRHSDAEVDVIHNETFGYIVGERRFRTCAIDRLPEQAKEDKDGWGYLKPKIWCRWWESRKAGA